MASSSSLNRKGKLSLKRKRTAECPTNATRDDGAVDRDENAGPGTGERRTEVDSFLARAPIIPIAESAPLNLSSSSMLHVKDAAVEPSQDRKGQPVSHAVIGGSSRLDINKMPKLQELPPWYGIKVDKPSKEQPTSSELEIKVGNLSMKWSPLPPYCRQCLVRSRQKRAADLKKYLSPSARCGDLKKNADSLSFSPSVQNDAKRSDSKQEVPPPSRKEKGNALGEVAQEFATIPGSLSPRMQNGKACSSTTNAQIDLGEPQSVQRNSIPQKNLISEQRCSNQNQLPSTPSKTLSNSATSGSTNERKVFIGYPGERKGEQLTMSGSPAHVDSSRTSSPLSSVKRDSSIRSSPSKRLKGGRVQKVLIKEFHAGQETLGKKSGTPDRTQLKTSSKAEPPLPFLPKPGFVSEGIGPGFKEKVDVKSLSEQQPKKSFGGYPKTVGPSIVKKVISSESHLKLTVGKVHLNSELEHSNVVHSNKASRPSLTSSQRGSSSLTSLGRDQSRNQELNSSSPEIIIIDSDEEDEPKIPFVTTPTCLTSNLKRKLSETFCDSDNTTTKKPKVANSATGASGSPAAKLTSDMKFHSGKEHNRSTFIKLPQGSVKGTSQSKLNVMPGRTAGPDSLRMPSSVPQAAPTRESVASVPKGSSSLPVRPRSVTSVSKESSSIPVKHVTPPARHPSSKKTNWNLSGNAKPLFKQHKLASVEAVPVKTSQVETKEQGNISQSKFSNNIQTQNQKSPIKENRSNSVRTFGSFFKKHDASTSSKLSTGMPSTPESRQPKNQSTFRSTSNWGFDELEKASTTSPAKHQLASTSGFQSARTIQTTEDARMYPREDSRTNLSKETQPHSMRGHQTGPTKGTTHPNRNNQPEQGMYINRPKQDSKSNHSVKTIHISTNRDSGSNQVSYRNLHLDQNTNWGITEASATVIQSCPLCLQSFHQSWTTFQRDGHIAKCLAESTDDVNW